MPSDGWEVRVRIRLLAAVVQAHVRRGHSGKGERINLAI